MWLVFFLAATPACESDDGSGSSSGNPSDGADGDVADEDSPGGCGYDAPGEWACNPMCDESCGEVETCTYSAGAFLCAVKGQVAVNDACDPVDSPCARGACLTPAGGGPRVCRELCLDNDDCSGTAACNVILSVDFDVRACGAPLETCELLVQDCAPGEGCYFAGDKGNVCLPAGPGSQDSPCTYTNDCAAGHTCMPVDGVEICVKLCDIDDATAALACETSCDETYGGITNLPGLGYCRADGEVISCDLLLQDCDAPKGCYIATDGVSCLESVNSIVLGEACVYANDCEPGLLCVNDACHQICNPQSPSCPPERPVCGTLQGAEGAGVCVPGT